jgi:DNA-binding beta-propeller fold protein YncE
MQNVETAPVTTPTHPDGNGLAPAQVEPSWLDRAFVSFLRWDGEKIAWAVLLIITVLSRTIGLGDRAMSHDESLHTVYSWKLYDGQGYKHDPMMHGPLKFHLTALAYFLFGVNDWSSRISVALFGIAMVWMAWLLRRWIGKTGAFLVAAMFAISPALLYHSRYIRDEVILCSLLVALTITVFRYLETRQTRWIYLTAVVLGLAFTSMEASFIYGGVFGAFLVVALAAELWRAPWPKADRRYAFRMTVSFAGPALAAGVLFMVMMTIVPGATLGAAAQPAAADGAAAVAAAGPNIFKLAGVAFAGIGLLAALAAAVMVLSAWGLKRLRVFPELDMIVLLFTLVLPFLAGAVIPALGIKVDQFNTASVITPTMMLQAGLTIGGLFIISALIGYYWLRTSWVYAAGIFWAIDLLLFTTFLTNGAGIVTGLIGSLGYWISQQEVQRGGQPWFFFYRLVPLYEFLPLLLAIGGTIAWLQGKARPDASLPAAVDGQQGNGSDVQRNGEASRQEDAGSASPLRSNGSATETERVQLIDVRVLLVSFFVFLVAATWVVFTYVGEKMAWHTVYFATSMVLLGGWWLGRVIDHVNWANVRAKGGLWLFLMIPLFLVALKAVLPTSTNRPFANISTTGLSDTAQWLLALVVMLVLAYLIWERVTAIGRADSWRLTAISLAAILAIFTVAVSYRFAFINYDYATEPMVYAHGTPDIKLAMSQVDEISRKIAGDHSLKVAYDDDSTWPLEWYLRDYTKRAYFGANPNREALDAPVIIVGDKNLSKVKPYLGDKYYEFKYRLVWWPRETYKDITWQKLWDDIRDPVIRGQFWDMVIRRRWTIPTSQWDPVHLFSLFVRKDVAAQVWDWGAPAPAAAEAAAVKDPYAGGQRDIKAVQQIGAGGVPGTAPGQFNFPRNVAIGPDGSIYVADSGNNRIQVFSPQGQFVRQWGSTCKLFEKTPLGCQGDGRGQFNEPWGIAVGQDGSVYVSDTWNHRIQKFDSQGNFVTMWGNFESTGGELGNPKALYGPRAVTMGKDGNVYVMDTGNKRVVAYQPDGTFVTQFGGQGLTEGRFDEPVGLAQDQDGNWYVTDTWNHRIQKFDPTGVYLSQWPVSGWGSQSVVNKPFVAIDPERKILYATDPENYRVLAFGLDGTFKATWGLYGNDDQSFALPTGIAVGPDGKVYVADGDAHRIMVFPPLQ